MKNPTKNLITRFTLCLLIAVSITTPTSAAPPEIFLLNTYDSSKNVIGWMMSEKLDGVRGVWDGEKLRTRNGNIVHAPDWFTQDFPPFALDGELWTKRANFANVISIVRRKKPDARWSQVRYHIFEVPNQAGGLMQRLAVLRDYLAAHPSDYLIIIPQRKITANTELGDYLVRINAGGGEGVVVRDPNTPYRTGRLSSALKVKSYQDTECVVQAILLGKGKYSGKMGALKCRMASGRPIKIGTGFTDKIRAQPPPIGSLITFKYYGLTNKGNPRFPVYLRIRQLPLE